MKPGNKLPNIKPLARTESLPTEQFNEISNKIKTHKTRNVTDFQHFLQHSHICESDIEWNLKLRDGEPYYSSEKIKTIPNVPFKVSDLSTESSKNKKKVSDITNQDNITPVYNLLTHKYSGKDPKSSLEFGSSLRRSFDKKYIELEKKWFNAVRKDRKEYAVFLPEIKEEIRLRKQEGKSPMEIPYNGFEGQYLGLPKYTDKLDQKNIVAYEHLNPPSSFQSTIRWQVSLRNYRKRNQSQEKSPEPGI